MMNFEIEHLALIEENEDVLHQIEIALFTKRYRHNKRHSEILRVQSISMVYAIWEGYMQQTLQLYIKYIDYMEIKFLELNDNIIAYHMENSFKQFREYPHKSGKKAIFFNDLSAFYKEDIHTLYPRVDTESNLGFDVMNRLLEQFGVEKFPECWEEYKYPNQTLKVMLKDLLRYRNSIAHGGDLTNEETVNQDVYNKYKKLIIDLMYGVHDALMEAINSESYKK